MKLIPLTQGKFALVDDADFDLINQFNWCAMKAGRGCYAYRKVKRTSILMHWVVFGEKGIDHRDGDGLNNQRYNLRRATPEQNSQSFQRKRVGSSSQYRGVTFDPLRKQWVAQIQVKGKQAHIGRFEVEANAARAYDSAAQEYFGEFAAPNFPL